MKNNIEASQKLHTIFYDNVPRTACSICKEQCMLQDVRFPNESICVDCHNRSQ